MASGVDHSGSSHRTRQQIAEARHGSAEAFGQMLESCRNYLTVIARTELDSRLRVKTAPSDLVQETFIEARRAFAEFHGDSPSELAAWLRQILLFKISGSRRRFCRAQKRDVRREIPMAVDDSHGEIGASLVGREPNPQSLGFDSEAEILKRGMACLTADHRQVIQLRHWEALEFEEIGRRMGRSAIAAQRLWARAVRRLREEVETHERG